MHLCGALLNAPSDALRTLSKLADCCIEAVTDGPTACTCWEPVFDLNQEALDWEATPTTRDVMCDDCAYRPKSPERTGAENYVFGDEELPAGDVPFWCHQGMRKPVRWRHRLGITVEATGDYYEPPMRLVDGVKIPYQADGRPGQRCAGWAVAAERLKALLVEADEA